MNNYKLKISIFLVLILLLLVILFYSIFGMSLSFLDEENIKKDRELNNELISSFKINNLDTIYDKDNNIYYYSVPNNYENKRYTLKLDLDEGYKYKIIDYTTNIISVNYDKEYNVLIYNDKYYYETKIKLTNLPIVSITTNSEITDNETNSIFKYINPYNIDTLVTYNSKIKIRGATTRRYDKKSYKIEMYDSNYEKEKNVNIENFYYGSSFILDAMFRDHSKIRNVLATDIWNLISLDFTDVNVYNEYVEVFINNEYRGLYSFCEPINRKNLNLNKSNSNNTSVIIKSTQDITPKIDSDFSNITEDTYLYYEMKYPNDYNLYSISWETILTKLSDYYNNIGIMSKEKINNIFDINNYIDMLIYNSFINNRDNSLKKNNYFYMKDLNSKINIQPWDMEFSFGLYYDEDTKYNFKKDITTYDNIDLYVEKKVLIEIKDLIINRYYQLKKDVLNIEYLDNLINQYKKDLIKGAASRDSKKWVEYDIDKEIEDVRTWLHNRIESYDNYIRSLENE